MTLRLDDLNVETGQTGAGVDVFVDPGHHIRSPHITLEPWQYRITAAPHTGAMRLGPVWLSRAPDLPMITVRDGRGTPAGVLLGFPIDIAGQDVPVGSWQAPVDIDLDTETGRLQMLRCLGGRFLWLCQRPDINRVYPDAATQISCVWDRDSKSAGATALAILDEADYAARFDHAMFATLGRTDESWMTAGLTAHAGIFRLLPNHYLDLDTWVAHRFDFSAILPPTHSTDDCLDRIIGSITDQIRALAKQDKQPVLGLTGGLDSRMILACARDCVHDLNFVTVSSESATHDDTRLARKIADAFSLRHSVLPRQPADRTAQERYLRRCGHCCADSNMRHHTGIALLAQDHVFVGGFGGDLAQAPFWYDDDGPQMTLTPKVLLGRLGLPPTEKSLRFLAWWLDGQVGLPPDQILDRAALELRIGPWAMAQYCGAPGLVRFAPLLTYDNIAMMFALPMNWKQSGELTRAIIGRLWPELLSLPQSRRYTRQSIIGNVRASSAPQMLAVGR